MKNTISSLVISLVVPLMLLTNVSDSLAQATGGCGNAPINVATDVCWDCMYPMKLGGVTILENAALKDEQDSSLSQNAICTCPTTMYPFVRIGLSFSYWEPARLVETVKTPYCFVSLGTQLSNPNKGSRQGSQQKNTEGSSGTTFAQVHYYIFPAMALISTVISAKCGGSNADDLDLAYITEIDPMWNDEMTNLLIVPETLLFAHPYAQYACLADAIASNVAGIALSPLFWCMGSQGPVYPIGGHVNLDNLAESNLAIAQKFLYKMSREWMICDYAYDLCGCSTYPIWYKSHYRFQISKPVKGATCYPIGESGMLWDSGKNPPYKANNNKNDNFLWVLFRKHYCCISYN